MTTVIRLPAGFPSTCTLPVWQRASSVKVTALPNIPQTIGDSCLYLKSRYSKSPPRKKPRRAPASALCSARNALSLVTTSQQPSLLSWRAKCPRTSTDHAWRYSFALLPSACSSAERSQAGCAICDRATAGSETRCIGSGGLAESLSQVPRHRSQLFERSNRHCDLQRSQSSALTLDPSSPGALVSSATHASQELVVPSPGARGRVLSISRLSA